MSDFLKPYEEKMKSSISYYVDELKTIRAGRANPAILDNVKVNYYGQDTPINQVANISVPEARLISIQPWDANILADIERAIIAADIGLNPSNDGKIIRLQIPALTTERRKDLTKQVNQSGENSKVAIRNIRREAVDEAKALEKSGEFSEDLRRSTEDDIQELTDKYIKEIDDITAKKVEEIMEI